MLILLIIYVFWLVYVVCRSCGDSKLLPYLGVRVKFFGVFTLLVILTVVGGVIFGGIFGSSYNNDILDNVFLLDNHTTCRVYFILGFI
jgi:hypothetical protein